MKLVSDSTKVVYLILMIVFIIIVGLFWMDYIGLINLGKIYHHYIVTEAPSVVDAADDEPSLIEREELPAQCHRFYWDRKQARDCWSAPRPVLPHPT